jgi:hypothetical protein
VTDPALSPAGTKTGRLQRACLALLREHEADGALPTSGRFLFYELVQRGVLSKQPTGRRRPDQDMTDALKHLRDAGLVPWDWIVDETRTLLQWKYDATVAGYARAAVERARLDCWAGRPPPLILTESRSLAGVLRNLAGEYLCPVAATNGQAGGFLVTDVAPLLDGNKRTVLYLGDHDLSGTLIEQNTRDVLERHAGWVVEWERVALLPEHVDAYQLPVIVKHDRRYRPPRAHQAVETEALQQQVIVGLVRARLDALLPEPLAVVLDREQAARARLLVLLAMLDEDER